MASSTTNPPAAPDPFDLGIHTPANLNRGARAALLQNSPAIVNGPIGVSPDPRRMAQTPSSPLNATTTTAAATEGARPDPPHHLLDNDRSLLSSQPIGSHTNAFCAKFEEAAQQFTTGPERQFAQQFANSFLDSWSRELSGAGPTPKPTYSSAATSPPAADPGHLPPQRQRQQQHRQQFDAPRRQGRPATIAPPREDLRVFIRLEASAPARTQSCYAIRTHICEKLGAISNKIRQVFPVRSGWAVQTADPETRDYLVEKQSEWAADLGATAIETNKTWFTYVISDFPRRLTDFHGKEVDVDSIPNRIKSALMHNGGYNLRSRGGTGASQTWLTKETPHSPYHPQPLRIFQANVGKIPPAHDCALALADSERYDVVLLQEPWTAFTSSQCITKTHPAYDTFAPVDTWNSNDTRPRVMTYVRRDPRLLADQIRPFQTRDTLWLRVNEVTMVNFYRQSDEKDALNNLLRWPVPERCLVAGDFNARHHTWQTGQTTNRGQDIASWASENDLSLLNTPDIPTNPHGNTIDLAFTNIPLAEAAIEDHLATSSDHFTLKLTLPDIKPVPMQLGRIRVTTDDELKRFVEIVELGAAQIPLADSSPSELDELASRLVNLLTSAARAAGRPSRKGARTAPWWTEECASAATEFRAIRRLYPLGFNQEVQFAKRDFHRVVRRAKRLYWRNLIDSFSDSSSVFKAVRWLKSPGAFQPPPLQVGDVVYETQIDKANALRRAALERRTAEDDIQDPWIEVHPPRSIPFPLEISLEEAQYATLHTGNTSPGTDNITVKLLEAVWHIIGTHVRRLFQACLTIGHHPEPFREAEVVMIAKPGRRDLTKPRAWRPISLLSCLGKGLERLIARRLAWAAIHYQVLHPQQAGALPKRSATDLVTALIHDIEEAFARNKVATLVTMDIQGAFDTVMRNRLVLRLREQGWPDHLARWAGSFMGGRSARVRYQDTVTASSPLQCGLPQGSPVSPILFLLYTEPIYRLSNPQSRFGYADDTAILVTGDTVDETAAAASKSIEEMIRWGTANGISFDPEKTEVMHFSRSKLRSSPAIRHGDVVKQPESALRWLGIWLDSRLSFRVHVEKWAAKAKAVAYHLRGLANTKHGPLPSAVRSAVRACVEPVLLHGAEAWYPGTSRPRWSQPSKDVPSSNQHLIQRMTEAMNQSMRAILPVWKTTPIAALHRESGIPPVAQLLEARRLRFSARLKSLDEAHPLASRTCLPRQPTYHDLIKRKYQALPEGNSRTRLRRTDKLLAPCARPKLIQQRFSDEQMTPLQIASKEETAGAFLHWAQTLDPLTLVVYSDGSLSSDGAASYGYTIHQNSLPILDGSGRLGPAEVFDAEATGALEGLKAALHLQESATRDIFICLDNLAAATCLRGTPSDSSQEVFLEFQSLVASHGATQVRWVPGHTKIPGNEQADKLAKAASSLPEPEGARPTLAYLRRIARQKPKEAFRTWWPSASPEQYKRFNLKATIACPRELSLPRTVLHHLLAARSLHGDFAAYHERFNHTEARVLCSCNRRKTPDHIFYCRKVPPRKRARLAPSPNTAVNLALGKDFDKFVKLAKTSAFFDRICPRY
ncbi:hypothetical protein MRS44_013914 [Fusarium solani]|uniref:uncharacterized protein n=1 Tax=Fusarium solani TaxID=169388 RepID=UPI0032C4963D|nr:hypothetical protein MRS44_013914 [Fusarium solani]